MVVEWIAIAGIEGACDYYTSRYYRRVLESNANGKVRLQVTSFSLIDDVGKKGKDVCDKTIVDRYESITRDKAKEIPWEWKTIEAIMMLM